MAFKRRKKRIMLVRNTLIYWATAKVLPFSEIENCSSVSNDFITFDLEKIIVNIIVQ